MNSVPGAEKCEVISRKCCCLLATAVAAVVPSSVFGQLRIATYNLEADVTSTITLNPNTDTVLEGIGNQTVNNITRPLDIVGLEETTSNSTTVQPLLNELNTVYGAGTYAQSPVQATQNGAILTGNGPNAIIFNTKTVQLISSVGFGTLGSGSTQIPRQEMRYQFRPIGYDASADFYVYVGHFKAGTPSSDANNQPRRNAEAQMIRANAATLPAGSRIIYTGDFNLTGNESTHPAGAATAEPAWQTLTSVGSGTLATNNGIDPINLGNGSWNNQSAAFQGAYSESTTSLKRAIRL